MDAYDASQIDNTVVDENFLEGLRNRQLADEEMDARDERFRQARVAGELDEYEREGLGGVEEEDLSSESESEDEEDEEEGYPSERSLNLDAYDCPLQEWITETRTRNEIKKRFRKFLNTYYEGIEMRKQWFGLKNKRNPRLSVKSTNNIPPPDPVYPVTEPKYLNLVANYSDHPGIGLGPGAQRRNLAGEN